MYERYMVTDMPNWLVAGGREMTFRQGTFIYHQNDVAQQIYVVKSGTVIILSIDPQGRERKVVLVGEGGTVGEMEAIVGHGHVLYSAKAFTDCELIAISVRDFMRWIDNDPRACRRMVTLLAEKLYAASSQSAEYTAYGATPRLAWTLLRMGPGTVRYTRQELAEACSVSLRTVNRSVKTLVDRGAISRLRGKIVISENQIEELEAYIRKKEEEHD